ncbi:uncharacterized protein BCR38DRAFT_482071 [Pseudomassariella vexata]|uniref:Uncharacterized protein n=1 Tax=Pseudomassariella vexata TaxID=1141098 RepID=A0A1Y2EB93_9PEZI|nr:uncharacterized protein BCR38DRAFT_482071 [Pseudomassariella vexata]ORY68574.1 hypothetical protein BCR38DRAFT_482071 [Pseudomassariella vexata]
MAPVSLPKQWQEEIQTKVKPRCQLKTFILYVTARENGKTLAKLLPHDEILTTYGAVTSEYQILTKRTKNSRLDDKPHFQVPKLPRKAVWDDLEAEQKAFYDLLEKKLQLTLSRYLKPGTVRKNCNHMFTMLLRLRQASGQPHLIKNHGLPDGAELDREIMGSPLSSTTESSRVIRLQDELQSPKCDEVTENPIIIYTFGNYFSRMMEAKQLAIEVNGAHGAETFCFKDTVRPKHTLVGFFVTVTWSMPTGSIPLCLTPARMDDSSNDDQYLIGGQYDPADEYDMAGATFMSGDDKGGQGDDNGLLLTKYV